MSVQQPNDPIKRIAVIGPESTGKSNLCEWLAEHYHTVWVPEYAREYLSVKQHPYTLNDIVEIYSEQYRREKELIRSANGFIFTDTEAIIARVWCEHVFGVCPDEIKDLITDQPYDLYLLTSPDLPWEPDPLRENPGKGDFFFEWYQRLLKEYGYPFGIVSGQGETRYQCAASILEKVF